MYPGRCFIVGDFNVRFDKAVDYYTRGMLDILSSAGPRQHISGSTHKRGHTLDLITLREFEELVTKLSVVRGLPQTILPSNVILVSNALMSLNRQSDFVNSAL